MADRIRTTHVGSLPRPPELVDLLINKEKGEPVDASRLEELTVSAVENAVARQRQTGIDIVNDGEMSKMTYATYVRYRCTGIHPSRSPRQRRMSEHFTKNYPGWVQRLQLSWNAHPFIECECDGELSVKDVELLLADLRHLRAAADKAGASDVFMTAASPGIIADYIPNRFYRTHEQYLAALIDVMRPEYEAIVNAGFTLQLDCPDLPANPGPDETEAECHAKTMLAIEAINAATAKIDPQRMRMHLCWGNGEGPHDTDRPLSEVLPIALKARPHAIAFEGANPRHEHEWAYFEENAFPDDRVIIPGVINNLTTFVEHPELVAQRISRYTRSLGADRVIAGVDCGFGTWAVTPFDPDIAFAKLRSLVEGAALASTDRFVGAAC